MLKAAGGGAIVNAASVKAILPGFTDTKLSAALTQNPEIINFVIPQIPTGRIAKPEDIALI
jgi:hypothetical protein